MQYGLTGGGGEQSLAGLGSETGQACLSSQAVGQFLSGSTSSKNRSENEAVLFLGSMGACRGSDYRK
jgi:predicted nucleotide-binding protein (sugar kinase/HSP70/actin superfamily)